MTSTPTAPAGPDTRDDRDDLEIKPEDGAAAAAGRDAADRGNPGPPRFLPNFAAGRRAVRQGTDDCDLFRGQPRAGLPGPRWRAGAQAAGAGAAADSQSCAPDSAPYVPGGWSRAFRAKLKNSAISKRSPREKDPADDEPQEQEAVHAGDEADRRDTDAELSASEPSSPGKLLHVRPGAPVPMVSKGVSTEKDW
jgi:hypothetical protein